LRTSKLRDTGRFADAPGRGDIEAWLARLARIVQPISAKEKEFNNHAYWTGLGVAAAGIAANDRSLFDWGIEKFDLGADAVTPDGTLPLEMKRGQRAIHYHFFALTPLVYLRSSEKANGLDLYARNGGAIKNAWWSGALRVLADPSWFALRAGATQDIAAGGKLAIDEIAWTEPYGARFGANGFDDILAKYRPLDLPAARRKPHGALRGSAGAIGSLTPARRRLRLGLRRFRRVVRAPITMNVTMSQALWMPMKISVATPPRARRARRQEFSQA